MARFWAWQKSRPTLSFEALTLGNYLRNRLQVYVVNWGRTARDKKMMYRTGVVHKRQGVPWISSTFSCNTDLWEGMQAFGTGEHDEGHSFESFPRKNPSAQAEGFPSER
jgi:hypothetical protein